MPRFIAIAALAVALPAWTSPAHRASADDLVHITSNIVYDVRPDQGAVRVTWDVTFENNDPQTSSGGNGGTVSFYEDLTLPVLQGASDIVATSASGDQLSWTLGDAGRSPAVSAQVAFGEAIFFGDDFSFSLTYEVAQVRAQSLLVTPVYAYVPVVAGGDEATVTVNTPSAAGWSVNVEAAECAQDGATFTCTGDDAAFLAALVEVSRPDAITSSSFEVGLKERAVSVTLSHSQGEEAAAQHLKELVSAGLPVIEEMFGFAYPGSPLITVSQGGRQAVLGYEGLTSCDDAGCSVVVSPVADDVTVLHELAHLWSGVHAKRWLAEGFAQMIAEDAASALPPGLVQGEPPQREPASVDLRLDEWADVSSLVGATDSELEVENAGYDLSLRFLYLLRSETGGDALKQVNAAIAASGTPADSRHFLDLVEELSGKRVDGLFGDWVFGETDRALLPARREARDRLEALAQRAAQEGLSDELPNAIRAQVAAWSFDSALAAIGEAEINLVEYGEIKAELSQLRSEAEAAGLSLPSSIEEALRRWEFAAARLMFSEARQALDAYQVARERVDAPRNLWARFGLLGSNPENNLTSASDAFATGDFRESLERSNEAADAIDSASETAFRRLLILALVLVVIAAGIGVAVWISNRREKQFAEL
jgi:hypothetical protein